MSSGVGPRHSPQSACRPLPMTPLRVALVGQPNSGKSTLFNALVGYRAVASNFPGTTVEATTGRAVLGGRPAQVLDLPGTYSLHGSDRAERVTRDYLLSGDVDAVINVLDASLLSRSLELTLELAELGIPLVVCLNMSDEAEHKGISVDEDQLAEALGVPVVRTVASRGVGLKELASMVARARAARPSSYSNDVEEALEEIRTGVGRDADRRLALSLLTEASGDLEETTPHVTRIAEDAREKLARARGEAPDLVLAWERHALAARLFQQVAQVGHAHLSWRERADDLLMHPILAYPILVGVLLGVFLAVFHVGGYLEEKLLPPLEGIAEAVAAAIPGIGGQVLGGALEGLAGGVAIALPFLVPFLVLLSLLEDVGYLPRVGFLMDGLMHRLGLHGKSILPLLLGYGCSVPAVMATRILEDDRDRFITAVLATMIPCAGRTIVVLGLVGRFVGPYIALGLYVMNLVVLALVGWGLSRIVPGMGPGLILEIPPYRQPTARTVLAKTWLRLREFVLIAWPLLVVSSATLALIQALGWTNILATIARPFTWPLGLPAASGIPLIFGVLRKELSLVMLGQALGTADLAAAMSAAQMVVFTVFILFYIPCVAAVGALGRELGLKRTVWVLLGTTGLALLVGVLVRAGFMV
ncbi:MAG: ferrous iron transport protein B [Candidatus Bipolaricaulota bacterium]